MPSSSREARRCLPTHCTGFVTTLSLQRLGTGLHMISRKTTKSLCHGSSLSASLRPRTCIRAIAFSDPAKKPSLMWRAVNDRQSPRYRRVVLLRNQQGGMFYQRTCTAITYAGTLFIAGAEARDVQLDITVLGGYSGLRPFVLISYPQQKLRSEAGPFFAFR